MELPEELLQQMGGMPVADVEEEVSPKKAPKKPALRVEKDKRKGKTATLITGYAEETDEVRELARMIKQKLAIGGSTRDGEILLQGDVRTQAAEILQQAGYKVRVIN